MAYLNKQSNVVIFKSESELEYFLNNATLPPAWRVQSKGNRFALSADEDTGTVTTPEAQDALNLFTGVSDTEINAAKTFVDDEVLAGH